MINRAANGWTTRDAPPRAQWWLSGATEKGGSCRAIPLASPQLVAGRGGDAQLRIDFPTVSGRHAELLPREEGLLIRDLGSRNGTFINGRRVEGQQCVRDGELVQFAEAPFRLLLNATDSGTRGTLASASTEDHALTLAQFERMLSQGAVVPHYQPIIYMADGAIHGFEVLGRSRLFGLKTARDLFITASQLKLEGELSRLFRAAGVTKSEDSNLIRHLFLNTHPSELTQFGLLDSLRLLREIAPERELTLEIHESAVTAPAAIKNLKAALDELDIRLAYDDFGAGQSRLLELVAVPPDYLKFDMSLIRDLGQAEPRRLSIVRSLVQMTNDLGITTVAEGIETEDEAAACREVGFLMAQGYHFGKPASVREAELQLALMMI